MARRLNWNGVVIGQEVFIGFTQVFIGQQEVGNEMSALLLAEELCVVSWKALAFTCEGSISPAKVI